MNDGASSDVIRAVPSPRNRRPRAGFLIQTLLLCAVLTSAGCAPQWVYTFVEAENLSKPAEKPILVFYRDHLDPKSSQVQDWLKNPTVSPALKPYVLCSLVAAYDPNRKYVAQYGVTAAPALFIIHPDGTYHTLSTITGAAQISTFLTQTKPPGKKPEVNIAVTRPSDFLMRAEGTYTRALDIARRQNRKLLIVYKWWLDPNSTEMIANRLSRPEVAARCTETVNCVLDWDYVPNRSHVAKYGVTKFPALIVVNPDGSYVSRQGLMSVEETVRFLSAALEPTSSPRSRAPRVSGPAWHWSPYHDRARVRAARAGQGLIIFYHSLMEDDSARVTRLLETPPVTEMFRHDVQCSLAWSSVRNREIMREYGVTGTPALVAVRPGGGYLVRKGTLTIGQVRDLYHFLHPEAARN